MYLTGMVDKRTLEKYEREAREKNRESWYLSWALDTNLEGEQDHKLVLNILLKRIMKCCRERKGQNGGSGTRFVRDGQKALYHFGRSGPQELRAEHDQWRLTGRLGRLGNTKTGFVRTKPCLF